MTRIFVSIFALMGVFACNSVFAAKYGYLIANVANESLIDTLYLYRNKVRFDTESTIVISQSKIIYELDAGRYEVLRKENVDTSDFNLVGKSLMKTGLEFRIKRNTVHYLGPIEIILDGKSLYRIKLNNDMAMLKSVCSSNRSLLADYPIRFLNSSLPEKNFHFSCEDYSLSDLDT